MEPDETKQPEMQSELPTSEGDGQDAGAPLEGHPLEELPEALHPTHALVPEALHPTHALVLEAHAALKRGIEGFDRRGRGHEPNIDDVRLAFRALDAVLAEVNRG